MKYLLYIRKSTEDAEKQILSLEAQLDKAKELFPDLDFIEVEPESASAFKPYNRPIFSDMLERIDKGEASGIIAWHPDRLSRNEVDAAAITYRIRQGIIKDLKFGSYNFDNSAEGILMLQMIMSQSQYYSAKLSKDVKRGNEKKLQMGWKPGSAPIGYINTSNRAQGAKIIIPDKDRFHLVRKMWDLMLTGDYSVPQILHIANVEWGFTTRKSRLKGGNPLSKTSLYGILSNPFYMGLIHYDGKDYKGSHQPMVSVVEFDRVQTLLGKKTRPRPNKHKFKYTGIIYCGECGGAITAEVKTKYIKSTAETKSYTYYHCTHKKKCTQKGSISEVNLEDQIKKHLEKIDIQPPFKSWAIQIIKRANDEEIKDRSGTRKALLLKSSNLQKQLDNLTRMRLQELVDDNEYIKQKKELLSERNKVVEQLGDHEDRAKKWLELTEEFFDFATKAVEKFKQGDDQIRRKMFQNLGNKFILKDGMLTVDLCPWCQPITKSYKQVEKEYIKVRTDKSAGIKDKTAAIAAVKSQWYPRRDSNPRP